MVFRWVLRLPCDLLIGDAPDKDQFTTDSVVDLLDWLHDIHHDTRQHPKVASDRMKARCDRLANYARFQEGYKV
jgi:hypothetical protein